MWLPEIYRKRYGNNILRLRIELKFTVKNIYNMIKYLNSYLSSLSLHFFTIYSNLL